MLQHLGPILTWLGSAAWDRSPLMDRLRRVLVLEHRNVDESTVCMLAAGTAFVVALMLAWGANWVTKTIVVRVLRHVAKRTRGSWDDVLVRHNVFGRLSHLVPGMVIYWLAPTAFDMYPSGASSVQGLAMAYMVLAGLLAVFACIDAIMTIARSEPATGRLPVRSFAQVVKIFLSLLAGVLVLSALLGKPLGLLFGGIGAMAAVLLLIFKDAILGLVAGIQLSANDMVRVGDWIEMPKYGADGDVLEISLTTVKVRNWDKTVATIPTYALVSDSFKNWRGMSESGGRRIKRAVHIDMTSIRFCTDEMLAKFRRFQHISEYIDRKQAEIAEYNAEHNVDPSELVNGRRLTNVGTFRAYVAAYLRHHPKVHQDMTFLVRHLAPTEKGLPIEIYVFSNDQVWANYEAIQADIFDHILAVAPEFDLRVFQLPTGADVREALARA